MILSDIECVGIRYSEYVGIRLWTNMKDMLGVKAGVGVRVGVKDGLQFFTKPQHFVLAERQGLG